MSTQLNNTGAGLQIGDDANEKVSFFGATPVAQHTPTQSKTNVGMAGSTTTVFTNTAFTGFGQGTTNVTVNDIVTALKKYGLLPQ